MDARSRYRFAEYVFDPVTLELRRDGRPVPLPRQPASVLLLLLERAGEIVPRREIRDRCWSGARFGVEAALNTTIRQVRSALGDSAAEARFIETLPRRGYRFRAPTAVVPPTPPAAVRTNPVARRSRIAASALLVLALASSTPPSREMAFEELPPEVGLRYSAAWNLLETGRRAELPRAVELLQTVVAEAPAFGPGWAALSEAQLELDRRAQALRAARRALGVAPRLADAHHALGRARILDREQVAAGTGDLERSVRLAPRDQRFRMSLVFGLVASGRLERARSELATLYEQGPLSDRLEAEYGWLEYLLGGYDRAFAACAAVVESRPLDLWNEDCATMALERLGRHREAADRVVAAVERWDLAAVFAPFPGEEPQELLRRYWAWRLSRLEDRAPLGWWDHYRLATLYARRGDVHQALEVLEAAAADHSVALLMAPAEPAFEVLRPSPRFRRLLRS